MKPILVLGESNIDSYVYCSVDRLCPEAPIPVLDVIETVQNYGMAGNVARNIVSLNYDCDLITNANRNDITKTRYVEKKTNHLFIRVDSGPKPNPAVDLDKVDYSKYELIIISDYNKGFLSSNDIRFLSKLGLPTLLDTKKVLSDWAQDITFIKINRGEYKLSEENIKKYSLSDKIIQTLGENGCEYQGKNYPVEEVQIRNLSGLGDSHLAAFAVKYIQTKDIDTSLNFANECATKVVQKRGTALIND